MDKEELKENIFEYVKSVGVLTSKGDVLGDEPIEEKVYTKKVNIGEDYGYDGATGVEVACVSLTSTTEDFKDACVNNVRINTKNRQEQWCNIFINEAPKDMLELIWKKIDRLES